MRSHGAGAYGRAFKLGRALWQLSQTKITPQTVELGGNDCGLLVDPINPAAIAEAIDTLVSNPDMAKRMGENGHRAVEERYNWANEEQKLFSFYEQIMSQPGK